MGNVVLLEDGKTFRVTCPSVDVVDSELVAYNMPIYIRATDDDGLTASTEITVVCKYVKQNRLSSNIVMFGTLLAVVNITVAVFCIIWTLVHSSHKIVRYAQPAFLCMICVGCIVSSSTIFFLSGEDDVLDASAQASADMKCQLLLGSTRSDL